MIDPLLRKSLTDLRVQMVGWGLGVGGLLFLTVLLYPSISSAYGDVWEQFPKEWMAFFGAGSLNTLEGYLNMEFFSYAPLALSVFAILAGTAALMGEEGQGTLDLLLAQPVGRARLALMKLLGLALANGVIVAIILALFWAAMLFTDAEVAAGRILMAFALLWPFETAVAFISVLLSLALSGRLFAGSLVAIILTASYILDSLANLISGLEPLRPLYPTAYYQGSRALVGDISWGYTAGMLGAMGVALALSILLFQRRDIGVRAALPFPRLRKGKREAV
ncbi:MAG: ABC transporter permease subunit [Chloroflexi bacterium]|nr:ABC transporter permease subunit [Chloroflexota bacterium]